jgi:hypothetical protein
MKSSIKKPLLLVALGIFTFLYVSPLQAQVVRDHLTKSTDDKVRDHRTKNTAVTIKDVKDGTSNTLLLGEAGTFIGTRTSIIEKYPSFKLTGKVNRIMITDKLHDGDNLIYKMESGNALHATVKEGKIIKYTWKDSNGKKFSGGDGDDVEDVADISLEDLLNVEITTAGKDANDSDDESAQLTSNRTCYNCKEICVEDAFGRHPDGGDPCWIECEPVDCSGKHTHELPGPVVGKTKQ